MAKNKIIYGGQVLIDLTGDTATAEHVDSGYTFHDKSGAIVEGTSTKDVDSTDATATTSEILNGRTAYARGQKMTGDMPNNGAVNGTISTKAEKYTVPQGYHDGSGKVGISAAEQAKIIASNIRDGVTILGVKGNLKDGGTETPQDKTVTPTTSQQVVTPDEGYTCLRQVTVNAIPYTESQNSAGGTTVTIG